MSEDTVTLYRPVGQGELDLIARDCDSKDAASGFVGYVTRLRMRAACLGQYTPQIVGGGPRRIQAPHRRTIEIIAEYRH